MRTIVLTTILIVGLMTSYSLAQMGHGMMRDSQMMQGQDMMATGQMVEHGKMMGAIKGMTLDVSTMIGELSVMMNQDMSSERMHNTSELMRDVAAEMNRMSFMMDRGASTGEEMKDLQKRISGIQTQMGQMNKE